MIDDDELLLYRLGEHPAPDAIRRAREGDSALRARDAALRADLDALRAVPVPAPAASMQRWRAALHGAVAMKRARPTRRFAPIALAAAALLLLGIGVGRWIAPDQTAPIPIVAAGPDNAGALLHLAATRRALAALPGAEDRTARIEAIIADNRLHALAAERAGDVQLARVLRAFEPVLLQLASLDADTDAGVRAQLDFEARTMQTKLRAAPSNAVQRL